MHGIFEGFKGQSIFNLAELRMSGLHRHPSLMLIKTDMNRIASELHQSLFGRWSLLETFDNVRGQLTLQGDGSNLRFERISVEHSREVGKVVHVGTVPGGKGSLVIAEVGKWSLEMPDSTSSSDTPVVVLQIRRKVARREGVEWDKQLEADECSEAVGPPLKVVRLPLDIGSKYNWSIEGFNPTLSTEAYQELDSIFKSCDADGDGLLTSKELIGVLGGNKFVSSLDKSGDGFVSLEEFLQFGRKVLRDRGAQALKGFIKQLAAKAPNDKLRETQLTKRSRLIFKALDRDNSGTIDRDEVKKYDPRLKFFNKLEVSNAAGGVTEDTFVKYVVSLKNSKNFEAVEAFLKHVETHCEARILPSGDDLIVSMTSIRKEDFIEQYSNRVHY